MYGMVSSTASGLSAIPECCRCFLPAVRDLLPFDAARQGPFEAWLQLFFGDIAALRYSQNPSKPPQAADESFWVRSGKQFKRASSS